MGCSHWTKQQQQHDEADATINKLNQNGFKSLAYVTTEFDMSESESDDEEKLYSFQSIKKNHRQILTTKASSPLNESNSVNKTSFTVANSVLNNRLIQSGV
ncbi:unnamed protein product [Rotaria socialis]|uniref:Uncharacterized protein n=1 Tax=Rotaria socialis TaxID=392032 RepID=A0A818E3H3_9BILA|nr:unnamed protein product [Rotaria socialis]CAF3449941.1 unnamed protein product [Rotaria socialis]CAF4110475.1 unnamed protein product [Rotaria socialis]CAF4173487.1 unnamed protein product [Rotaria socialis]